MLAQNACMYTNTLAHTNKKKKLNGAQCSAVRNDEHASKSRNASAGSAVFFVHGNGNGFLLGADAFIMCHVTGRPSSSATRDVRLCV